MICDICDNLLRPHPRRFSRENAKTAQLSQNPQPLHPIRSWLETAVASVSLHQPTPLAAHLTHPTIRTIRQTTPPFNPHHLSPTPTSLQLSQNPQPLHPIRSWLETAVASVSLHQPTPLAAHLTHPTIRTIRQTTPPFNPHHLSPTPTSLLLRRKRTYHLFVLPHTLTFN